MKTLFTILFCLFLFPVIYLSQGNVKQALYVVHVDASGKSAFTQRIFAYHFLNGSFMGRDEVMSFDGKKEGKDYIRTDKGTNLIYKDRYLITGMGNILDLIDKKVLFDGRASLVRCSNDSAVFYTNDIFKGKFYSIYDFKSKEYREVKDLLFKPRFGRDIEFDKTTSPFKVIYYPQGKPKVTLVADAGYGQLGTKDNFVPDPPLYWMDNDNFIYVHFNQANNEISINKVNVDSKEITVIGKIAIAKERIPASLTKISKDQLIFWLGNKQVFIDLTTSTVSLMDSSRPDHGFTYEFKTDPKGRVVKLNGKDIGKYHFETRNFIAGENAAAFVKELVIGGDSYQQGLMTWNFTKKDWEKVDADEVLTLAGWGKE
ncbi:hypothetical protein [Aurantibacillus circumpalustris]|uniref:hypothetical protein n=1 Tax=Aurantibacillus circumpalustris TaxID=3036359 RepID=UPI00295A8BE4|nr:hypothetical protein [Aurantibacillus circumpalustris]